MALQVVAASAVLELDLALIPPEIPLSITVPPDFHVYLENGWVYADQPSPNAALPIAEYDDDAWNDMRFLLQFDGHTFNLMINGRNVRPYDLASSPSETSQYLSIDFSYVETTPTQTAWRLGGERLVGCMRHDVGHYSVWTADEEATHSPVLIRQLEDNVLVSLLCCAIDGVYVFDLDG